ncbi:unnamed protein product, partial [marine sediment metagenome]
LTDKGIGIYFSFSKQVIKYTLPKKPSSRSSREKCLLKLAGMQAPIKLTAVSPTINSSLLNFFLKGFEGGY